MKKSKVGLLLSITCAVSLTIMQPGNVFADESFTENSGGGSNSNEIKQEVVLEDVQKEDTPVNQQLTDIQKKEPVVSERQRLTIIAPRSVDATFTYENEGVTLNYKVLSEDTVNGVGTVQVGNGQQDALSSSSNAFPGNDSTYTGKVVIPETISKVMGGKTIEYTVTEICGSAFQNSLATEIVLPSTLKSIGFQAFLGTKISALVIPEGVEYIGDKAFSNNSLQVVNIPRSIKKLGSTLFNGHPSITTIYLDADPDDVTLNIKNSNSAFSVLTGKQEANIVAPNKDLCLKWKKLAGSWVQIDTFKSYLTYEVEVDFVDQNFNSLGLQAQRKLMYRNVNYVKNVSTLQWTLGTNVLPALPSGYIYWTTGIYNTTNKGNGDYLLADKIIAFKTGQQQSTGSTHVNKTYDGEEEMGAKWLYRTNFEQMHDGIDMFFRTIVRYGDATTGLEIDNEWGSSEGVPYCAFTTKNVADSGTYNYYFYYFNRWIRNINVIFSSPLWEMSGGKVTVSITPATISINPTVDNSNLFISNNAKLPEIKGSQGDTKGTYTWDAGQTPKEGTYNYKYTFVPDNVRADGPAGKNILNYTKEKETGEIAVTFQAMKEHKVTFKDKDGKVLDVQTVNEGAGAIAPTAPTIPGYTFKGWDKTYAIITSDITVQALYDINQYTAKFDGNGGVDGKDITVDWKAPLGDLQTIKRDGYKFVGWFTQKEGGTKVTKDTLMPLDGVTYYAHWEVVLPSGEGNIVVEVDKKNPIKVPSTEKEIGEAVLTDKEYKEYLAGTDVTIRVVCERIPDNINAEIKEAMADRKGVFFDISMYKKVGNNPEEVITKIKKPIKIIIDIPSELYPNKTIKRVFDVMRIHDRKIDFLNDLDLDDKTVTIETNQFSTYILCYKDSVITKPEEPKKPETEDTTNIMLYACVLGLSMMGVILFLEKRMKIKK